MDGGVLGKRSYGSGVNTLLSTADVLIAWATSDHHVFLSYGRLVLRIPLLSSRLPQDSFGLHQARLQEDAIGPHQ